MQFHAKTATRKLVSSFELLSFEFWARQLGSQKLETLNSKLETTNSNDN